MMDRVYQVLVVDDDFSVRESITHFLNEDRYGNYVVQAVASGEEAIQLIEDEKGNFDVALIDQYLGDGLNGIDILRFIKANYSEIEVIIFTAYDMESIADAFEAGAYRFIAKPPNPKELSATIRFAAEHGYSRRERKLLTAFQEVSGAINSSLELHEIFKLSCEWAVKLFSADHSGLVRFEPDYETGVVAAEYPPRLLVDEAAEKILEIKVRGVPAEERLVFKKEIINIQNVVEAEEELGSVRDILLSVDVRSILVVPVTVDDKVVASFSLDSVGRTHSFTSNEIEICKSFASHIGNAIKNSQLYAAEAAKRKEAETLRESFLSITKTLDRKETFAKILSGLRTVVPYDYASIQLQKGDVLEVIDCVGFNNKDEIVGLSFCVKDDNPNQHVLESKQAVIVNDVVGKYVGFSNGPFTESGIRSWLGVPMMLDNNIIGMLTLDKRETGFFTNEHARLALTFATQAAIAIRNTDLLEEAKQKGDYIHSLYESSRKVIELHDLGESLENILIKVMDTVLEVTRAWRAFILLVDDDRNPKVLASTGAPDIDSSRIRERGITWQVFQSCQPVFIPDMKAAMGRVNPKSIEEGVAAAACLPLRWGGEKIGALWIQYDAVHNFTDAEKQALQIYADQSAISYENARLIKDLKELSDAASEMEKATEDPSKVLKIFMNSAKGLMKADRVLYWAYNFHGNSFLPQDMFSDDFPENALEVFRQEEGKSGKATRKILDDGYLECKNISKADDELLGKPIRELLISEGVKSLQGICIETKGEKLGVLYVDYLHERSFTAQGQALLRSLAETGAMALKQARIQAQLQKARDLANLVARFSALNNDFKTTWRSVADEAMKTLGCDAMVLYQHDEKSKDFEYPPLMAGVWYPDRAMALPTLPATSIVRAVWEGKNSVIKIEDTANHHLTSPEGKRRFTQDEKTKALVAMVLEADNRKVGVIFINYRKKRRFSDEEIRNIRMFGYQLAIAIRYVRRYEELKKIKGMVGTKTALDWFEVISSSWGHEVKNGANTVRNRALLIREYLKSGNIEELYKELDRLDETVEELKQTAIMGPVYKDSEFSSYDVNQLISEHVKYLPASPPFDSVEIGLELEEPPDGKLMVKVHKPWVGRVMEMLLKNSIQAMNEAGCVERRIKIGTRLSPDKQNAEIIIQDTGPGVPEEMKPLLFFEKIEKANRNSGQGIGLMVVKLICDFHGAEVQLVNDAEPGAKFLISFPLEKA